MKQAIVILLNKNKQIESIRKKYCPDYKKYNPHITLAFPFKDINQIKLNKHIKDSLKKTGHFKLELQGIKKSPKEFYLYLLIKKGNNKIMKIHKNLYSKLLNNWLRKDIPYIPHLTIGVFNTKKQINSAFNKIKKQNINFKQEIKSIQLLTLKKDDSIKSIKNFKLES